MDLKQTTCGIVRHTSIYGSDKSMYRVNFTKYGSDESIYGDIATVPYSVNFHSVCIVWYRVVSEIEILRVIYIQYIMSRYAIELNSKCLSPTKQNYSFFFYNNDS